MSSTIVKAVRGGVQTNLSDGTLCWVEASDGLGMTPLHRLTERGPQQQGDSDVGFRLDPRSIKHVFGAQADSMAGLYALRGHLLRLFKPSSVPLSLLYELPTGDVRQIDVVLAGDLELPSGDRSGFYQKVGVTFRAADPTFYDPEMKAVIFGVGGSGTTGLTFPATFPWSFGASTIDTTKAVAYVGDWATFPVIEIDGPIANPVITNLTVGAKLDLTGVTIAAGDSYIIDCRYGFKTVVDAAGVNRIDKLSDDSDLATFRLEADPDAPGGVNSIRVQGSGATSATEIFIRYYNRYVGI